MVGSLQPAAFCIENWVIFTLSGNDDCPTFNHMMTMNTEQGKDPMYLLWKDAISARDGHGTGANDDVWSKQVRHLSQYGIGMPEALGYLYHEGPSFEAFSRWILQHKTTHATNGHDEPVLSQADLGHWNENGYVVVKNAVSPEQCEAARDAIWEFLGASPHVPETWYLPHPQKKGLMVDLFQHPALNDNRSAGRIKKAYEQLYGATDIYLLIDKVSFNPPETQEHKFNGCSLHWDVSLHQPIPFALQGLLYLNDTGPDDGAFHCVPGFHTSVGNWIAALPQDADPRQLAPAKLQPVPVSGNAGDLVIWHQALPHCATPNRGKHPRMVQYIAYKPVNEQVAEVWK
ncbi:MAG: phytanoyl-CoA dioxygenase family protein [Chitinophagales bacterium]|nr:phytanoyl-CoA dioxygenase family protein [Chitinophagales bacterium]